jgi:F-type H+-transporting ATPase subunit delta
LAAQTTIVAGIPGRYASALFDLALERKAIDEVADDLQRLAALIDESPDLAGLVRSPVLTRAQQVVAMGAVAERAGMHELTRNFVGLVARNRRLLALTGMIAAFALLRSRHRGEITGEVISARPLSDAQVAAVKTSLAQAMGQEVLLNATVDKRLLGGLIVRVGSRMVDASLRTKLQSLQFAMKGAH